MTPARTFMRARNGRRRAGKKKAAGGAASGLHMGGRFSGGGDPDRSSPRRPGESLVALRARLARTSARQARTWFLPARSTSDAVPQTSWAAMTSRRSERAAPRPSKVEVGGVDDADVLRRHRLGQGRRGLDRGGGDEERAGMILRAVSWSLPLLRRKSARLPISLELQLTGATSSCYHSAKLQNGSRRQWR